MRHLRIPGWVPPVGAAGAAATAIALTVGASSYFEGRDVLSFLKVEAALRQAEVQEVEGANADLREHVARLEQRLAAANRQLAEAQGKLRQAAAQNSELRGQLYSVELKLSALQEERDAAEERLRVAEEAFAAKSSELDELTAAIELAARHGDTQRTVLAGRLKLVEAEKEAAAQRVAEMKRALDAAEQKARAAVADRDRMRHRLAQLDNGGKTDKPVVANAAGEATKSSPAGGWLEIESLLASVGVDVASLKAKFNLAPTGVGGPFYAFDPREKNGAGQVPVENLKKLLTSLPLAAPLDDYRLESDFGTRTDPLNKRRATHSGLDLAAPYRTPVFSTAPGVVVFAGAKGAYGRTVEIDHGHGIVTRYAHLHRTMVVTGQRVTGRYQIGQLGSTGRSTGPHLHYEILVNGVAQDPARFLEAGRNAIKVVAEKK
ncbi:MAG: peptidoglycan DD-metalloendopeptidase family protein [Rhodospirillales bacterium]|nr:peptidoglycan DD-metalloendopeptidase family protein [Rhodospirillales bacterium]